MTLRKQAYSGVRWTTFSSLGRATMQVLQVAILARLLVPADFGLIAVVIALMAFLQIFADAGVSNAIIHYQDITHKQLSSLYWLNVSVSIGLALILITSSSRLAGWYHEPALQSLLMIASLTLVVGSLSQQLRIHAQKELNFSKLALVEITAMIFGFVSTVVLAGFGAGVYSLALGSFFSAVAGCIAAWVMLAHGWRPLWRLNVNEIRPFLKFGGYMVGNNLATTFNNQVDILIGTTLLGTQSIGLYSVPKTLTNNVQMVINPIVTQVGLPIMAKSQHDMARLNRIYMKTIRMTASINFPIYVATALFAPEIIHLLLGEKWQTAVSLLQIFACWGLVRSIGNPVGSLLFARGKAHLAFKWNLALLFFIGPTIWLGGQFGAEGIAIAYTGLMAALYVPMWYFLIRPLCGASLTEYSTQLGVPLVLSLTAGVFGYFSATIFDLPIVRLSIGLIAGGVSYIVLSYFNNRTWFEAMRELLGSRTK